MTFEMRPYMWSLYTQKKASIQNPLHLHKMIDSNEMYFPNRSQLVMHHFTTPSVPGALCTGDGSSFFSLETGRVHDLWREPVRGICRSPQSTMSRNCILLVSQGTF